jgi:hypothetical protein
MPASHRRPAAALALLFGSLWFVAACDTRSDYYEGGDVDLSCRGNPGDCFGDIGGACDHTDDCVDGVCCRDKNCDGGMCVYICDHDADCPNSQLCEHGYCFFACNVDADCGPAQSCEHGKTICEYEK